MKELVAGNNENGEISFKLALIVKTSFMIRIYIYMYIFHDD